MDFNINCPCGATLRVTTADAGGTKTCRCGSDNQIPSLGELRRLAGQDRYEISIVAKIRNMVAEGKLPTSTNCSQCGLKTTDVLNCSVECESPHAKGRGFWTTIAVGILAPMGIFIELSHDYSDCKVHGRELVVEVPLTLCSDCGATAAKQKRRLRELIRSDSLYRQLLKEYPNARITVSNQ